jgi:hypothetical protein
MQSLWSGYFYYIPMPGVFSAYYGINAVFIVTGFSLLLTLMVMNIDLSRYQLATLTSVIESVRNHEQVRSLLVLSAFGGVF